MSTFMAGQAVLEAAEDALRQIKHIAAIVMRTSPNDIEVAAGKAFLRDDPAIYLEFRDLVHGYEYPGGNSIGGQIMGIGTYIMRHLSPMDKHTGHGHPGPGWTVGAQAVEVLFDPDDNSFRCLRAVSVLDAGRILNPKSARQVVSGGMCMGIGYGEREQLYYNDTGVMLNPQFRTYHMMRYGETPEYVVEFLETPDLAAPFGSRGLGEHGIVAIPAALANALSCAAEVNLDDLPVTPERIWRRRRDSV